MCATLGDIYDGVVDFYVSQHRRTKTLESAKVGCVDCSELGGGDFGAGPVPGLGTSDGAITAWGILDQLPPPGLRSSEVHSFIISEVQ